MLDDNIDSCVTLSKNNSSGGDEQDLLLRHLTQLEDNQDLKQDLTEEKSGMSFYLVDPNKHYRDNNVIAPMDSRGGGDPMEV